MDELIELKSQKMIQNDIGEVIEGEITYTEIFGKRKSIKQSEFYQAQATGLKPEIAFIINSFEYNNEQFVRYSGREYKVLRTYQKSIDKLELVLEGVVNG